MKCSFRYCLEFAKVCEQSTDFHFPNLEQQLEQIEQSVLEAKDWRLRKKTLNLDGDGDRISIKSYGSAASIDVNITTFFFS